jgi:hypothetical protein
MPTSIHSRHIRDASGAWKDSDADVAAGCIADAVCDSSAQGREVGQGSDHSRNRYVYEWNEPASSAPKARSLLSCYPCHRYKSLPMCPERTHELNGGKGGNRTLDPGIMSVRCRTSALSTTEQSWSRKSPASRPSNCFSISWRPRPSHLHLATQSLIRISISCVPTGHRFISAGTSMGVRSVRAWSSMRIEQYQRRTSETGKITAFR